MRIEARYSFGRDLRHPNRGCGACVTPLLSMARRMYMHVAEAVLAYSASELVESAIAAQGISTICRVRGGWNGFLVHRHDQ